MVPTSKPLDEPVSSVAVDLGRKLRLAREARGLSQADVEAATKIDRANLRKYEKGQINVTLAILKSIADALDADLVIEIALRDRKGGASRP